MKRKDGMGRAGSESEGHGSLCLALPSPSHKLLLASIKGSVTIDKVAVVVVCLWVALATTVSRSRDRLKKLPWVPPETLLHLLYFGVTFC